MKRKIAPSILSADFTRLGDEIRAVEKAGADLIHVDVMDGHFVPNLTIGPPVVKAIRKVTALPLDCHLMIENPSNYVDEFAHAGADMISIHIEVEPDPTGTLRQIRNLGKKAGLVLNPATPASAIQDFLEECDYILVMSVNPGFSGQKFIPLVLPKLKEIKGWIQTAGLNCELEIDGGINAETVKQAALSGAEIFVAGHAIFRESDYKVAIQHLRSS